MDISFNKFHKAYTLLKKKEFGNKPEKFLHKNPTEEHFTLGGVYEKYHSDKLDWHFVHNVLNACDGDIKRASVMLFNDVDTSYSVANFFKIYFWDKLRLDEVQSQKICNEIFLNAVHNGQRVAIKLAQKQIKVMQDGIIGNITIKALNNFNEDKFDTEFDILEVAYYKDLIEKNPRLKVYENGFVARAESV